MIKVRLADIALKVSSGLTPNRSNEEFWQNGIIDWVKTEQIGDRYIFSSTEKISLEALEKTSIKLNPINTISIAMYGEGKTRGSVSILKNEMTTNQACCNIIVDEKKADVDFIYYKLKTQYDNLRALSSGVRKNLNSNDIKEFEIAIPSLAIQQKIASVLSALDDKIELNNKINAELEAMAKTLFDYWFVQFDFPDAEGKPYKSSGGEMVYNPILKKEVPKGWEVNNLGKILYTVNESIEPNQYLALKYLPIDKLPTKQIYYYEYSDRKNANSSLIKFSEDDILLGAMRVYFHRVCNAIEDGISRSTIMVIRAFDAIYKNFGLFTLCKDEAIDYANKNSTGTSIPYAKWENGIANYEVVVPSRNILEKFEIRTTPILDNLKIRSKQNQELVQLRDWLLPMLMNGQVTVGEAEEKIEMVAEGSVSYMKC